MWRSVVLGSLVLSVSNIASAQSLFSALDPAPETRSVVVSAAPEMQSNPITGFIEFLFGDAGRQSQRASQQWFGAPPRQDSRHEQEGRLAYANASSDDPLCSLFAEIECFPDHVKPGRPTPMPYRIARPSGWIR